MEGTVEVTIMRSQLAVLGILHIPALRRIRREPLGFAGTANDTCGKGHNNILASSLPWPAMPVTENAHPHKSHTYSRIATVVCAKERTDDP